MNLSAQDHQNFFTCDTDVTHAEMDIMQLAWRERDSFERINMAYRALEEQSECAPALILLAEEECKTVTEAETMFRRALKAAEANYRRWQCGGGHYDQVSTDPAHRRDVNVLVYVRRRMAMCARRLGRLKEAAKMMRDVSMTV
jgi:hypothetical protein